jgi:hypothetical protein
MLAVAMVAVVVGSLAKGFGAGFFDVELSAVNYMCAGTVNLEFSERLTSVDADIHSEWYSE